MEHLSDLTLFVRVAERGAISAAARDLDLSPALASQRIQRLERSLGVRLFNRTTRRLSLTAEGNALRERAQTLLDEFAALGQQLRRGREDIAGPLRISMSSSFGRRFVSPLLPRFLALHPAISLQAHLSDQVIDLVAQGMDLAIRIGELPDSTLVARPLALNRRVLCAAPSYLRRAGAPKVPADLQRHNCLLMIGQQGRQDRWQLEGPRGAITVTVRGNLESNLGEVLRDAAVAGAGICVHSTWHIADDLRSGQLVPVLPGYPPRTTGIYAVLPQRRFIPARTEAFIAFLREEFGEPPIWEREVTVIRRAQRRS